MPNDKCHLPYYCMKLSNFSFFFQCFGNFIHTLDGSTQLVLVSLCTCVFSLVYIIQYSRTKTQMEGSSAKCYNFNVSSIEVTALSHGTCQIQNFIYRSIVSAIFKSLITFRNARTQET